MIKRLLHRKKLTAVLLAGAAVVACPGGWRSACRGIPWWVWWLPRRWLRRLPRRQVRRLPWRRIWRWGFHGFGGGSRFGDGGFFDRSSDAGFGRGGWGSIHNASSSPITPTPSSRAIPSSSTTPAQFQQNRTNEANTLQQNRFNEANNLQQNRYNDALTCSTTVRPP